MAQRTSTSDLAFDPTVTPEAIAMASRARFWSLGTRILTLGFLVVWVMVALFFLRGYKPQPITWELPTLVTLADLAYLYQAEVKPRRQLRTLIRSGMAVQTSDPDACAFYHREHWRIYRQVPDDDKFSMQKELFRSFKLMVEQTVIMERELRKMGKSRFIPYIGKSPVYLTAQRTYRQLKTEVTTTIDRSIGNTEPPSA